MLPPLWNLSIVLLVAALLLDGPVGLALIGGIVIASAAAASGLMALGEVIPVALVAIGLSLSGYLAMRMLEQNCSLRLGSRSSVGVLCISLTSLLWLSNPDLPHWLQSTIQMARAGVSMDRVIPLASVVLGAALFSAGTIALVVSTPLIVFEALISILFRGQNVSMSRILDGVRMPALATTVALSLYLLSGYLVREFDPLALLKTLRAFYG